jgi:hypothetical protein
MPLRLTLSQHITTPPTQSPSIASAGIALSPFEPATDYTATATRIKRLWIEFKYYPPDDPQDLYFGRKLPNIPDPLLPTTGEDLSDAKEPSLPIDGELARVIVPDLSNDSASLDAMQPLLLSASSPVHFFLCHQGRCLISPSIDRTLQYALNSRAVNMSATAELVIIASPKT